MIFPDVLSNDSNAKLASEEDRGEDSDF